MNASILLVSIEGNIGSGKSTLMANLKTQFKDQPRVIFLKEPVDEWSLIKDEHGVTMLEKFYADQRTYSFSFQMMAYISRLKLLKDLVSNIHSNIEHPTHHHRYVIITERSLYTDKMVFAKMLYDTGKMEYIHHQIYLQWFNAFADEFPVSKIIYVKANPDVCHARIATRHRDGEEHIPLEYLQACDKYHNDMLDATNPECVCQDQLVLDGNCNIYENDNVLHEWLDTIDRFVNTLHV